MSKHPAAALPLALLICGAAFAQQAFEPIGLPSSRSSSPVFNRYLSLPPFTARIPGEWEWTAAGDLQISQMIAVIEYSNPDGSTYMDPILDYETLSLEAPLALGLGRGFALELDLQVQLLWSGVLDDTVQGFHRIFGFPNGGRDRVRSYRRVVDLPTRNGFDLSLDGAAVLVSDPVLSLAWAFYRGERLALTSRLLFAAPLGLGRGLAGTELPQNGAGFWADWRASRRLGVYANAGAVLPWEALRSGPAPLSMAQARLSVLFETIPGLFVYGNLDFKTSPLDSAMDYVGADPFLEPNTDLTVGLVWTPGAARADGRFRAFGVQEDPITHNGADISWTGSGRLAGRLVRVRDEAAGAGSGTAASAAGAAGAAPQALADYRMRVQGGLDYARAHLDEAPGLADLAREAAFSPFHFHRIFAALTGETPAEHVRRLRLEKAAGLLRLRPELSVTRIGADCGFATPSAFARDFRKRFGTTPGAYRAGSAERPRRSRFLARLAAGKKKRESDNARTAWRIETFPARRLACVSHTGPYGSGVGRAWGALFAWAVPRGYAGKGAKLFGLSWDNPEVAEAGVLRYDACLEVPPDAEDRKGAVFFRDLAPLQRLALPYKGPEAGFSEAFRRLYGEALPLCGREAADFPVIERYLAPPKGFFRRVFDVELCLPLRD